MTIGTNEPNAKIWTLVGYERPFFYKNTLLCNNSGW
ncbi:MAG: hypothetical protein UU88_C0007G0009 [Parcubacteria group bacterium GW2011_GWC1_42_11]|uniref:Uncharacterized protein n=1 Tax=Candidatus Nomurabacteria bacterium GW2011_GWC2_42_20 TaxID=1618756 RepID=A0A0G0ZFL1_9BACT|nr:MAG: hypothetical protein UU88_C0007G0009 [Parcubacteria group bacterium GW2011_GWC1_42_11]KKS47469.1 MAG: hypothetical protein UV12_C0007G0009 [Candidatus Nomurabacteria bacterium GW2011_GWC2_42_20]